MNFREPNHFNQKLLEMVVLLSQLQVELRNCEKWMEKAIETTQELQEISMDIQDKQLR